MKGKKSFIETGKNIKRAGEVFKKSNDSPERDLEERTYDLKQANRLLKQKVKELKKTQSALSESEKRYRELTETVKDALFVQDIDLNLTYVSPSIKDIFGYSVEEGLKLKMKDILTPSSLEKAIGDYKEMLSRSDEVGDIDIPVMEYEYIRKDGSTFWGELKVTFLRDSKGRITGTQGILRDIDERKKAEESLVQSEYRFRHLFDFSPQAIALTEVDTGRLIDVNDKFCEMTKFIKKEIINKTTTELGFYSQKNRKKFMAELDKKGTVQGLEMEFRTKDGLGLHARMYANIIEFNDRKIILTIFHDISEETRLRKQFYNAQRMEAIGNLAGGIAHDFNNLLMGIQGNVSLMLFESNEGSHPFFNMLKDIEKNVKSGAKLTRQLLDYASKGRYEVRPVDINQLVTETLESFQRTRRQLRIHKDLDSELRLVEADQSQIEQVLLNLFINAADAMSGGGDLSLLTRNITEKEMEGNLFKPKPGHYVLLTVTDTGIGMDEDVQERIFEPFFTTKEMGKGTGLGLASVYGIIKGHGGYIVVESSVGRGTTFNVFLPSTAKKNMQEQKSFSSDIIMGKGTVLIVDDEETVLNVGSIMLEKLGYDVLKAKNGEQALEIFHKYEAEIDLIILDLIMPGMQGSEVYDIIKKIRPDARFILSSGYSIDGEARTLLNRGCNGFIQKPFDINTLSEKVRQVIYDN